MATVAELIVRARAETRDVEQGFARMNRGIEAFGSLASQVGRALTTSLTLPLAAAGAAVFSATAKMDSLQRGLLAVAGSAGETQRQLARLSEIAKAPGIGFAEAIQGSVRLQSIGFSAALAERSLKAFANAIALTGGGRAELDRVGVQLGQLASKGKVLAQDLRPIIEAAPAVGRALREAFGTVDAEAISNLNLTTQQFLDRLLTQLEKLPRVTGGLGNAFENLKDSIFRAFAAVGEGQANALTTTLNSLASKVEALGTWFSRLSPSTQKAALYMAVFAAGIGPATLALSGLIRATQTFLALSFVSTISANVRAFIAFIPAINSMSGAMAHAGVAVRGLAGFLIGPAGLAIALTAAAALFVRTRLRAEEMRNSVLRSYAEMDQASAKFAVSMAQDAINALDSQEKVLRARLGVLQGQGGFSEAKTGYTDPNAVNVANQLNRVLAERTLEYEKLRAAMRRTSETWREEQSLAPPAMELGGGALQRPAERARRRGRAGQRNSV